MELELKDISKKYGKKEVLHNFNADFTEGIYGLLGPNGAGKTTLMNIVAGIIKPDNGAVYLNGNDTVKMGKEFRKILGYLPQNPGLYPFYTGEEILKYFAKLKGVESSSENIYKLLDMVHLSNDAKKKVGDYSGGMKKRMGIAITLLNDPQIIIMDEPTAGLDPEERIRFRNIVSRIKYNSIIIISTHIVSDIEHIADNVMLLGDGQLLANKQYNSLLEDMKDKVWTVDEESKNMMEYSKEYKIVNVVNVDKEHIRLRIINEDMPSKNAVKVYPDLEDVYMDYFGEW